MNKKGFTIIETLIVTVIMSISMLLIYSSYSRNYTAEKKRVYYNDVVDLYKTQFIKQYIIKNTRLAELKTSFASDETKIFYEIGTGTLLNGVDKFFYYSNEINDLINFYEVSKIAILKPNFDIISKCSYNEVKNNKNTDVSSSGYICQNSFRNYSNEMLKFVKSLGSNVEINPNEYLLIVSYQSNNIEESFSYIRLGDLNE